MRTTQQIGSQIIRSGILNRGKNITKTIFQNARGIAAAVTLWLEDFAEVIMLYLHNNHPATLHFSPLGRFPSTT